MRLRMLFVLWALTAAAAAGPIDEARGRIRSGTIGEASAAIEALVSADNADAVKALQQGVETVLARLKREQDDFEKTTRELVDFQDTIIDLASRISEMIGARKDGTPEYKALLKKREQAAEKNKKLKEEQAAAKAKVMTSAGILAAALSAFGRFRSDGAVEAIERVAAAKSGRVSRACTGALVRIGAARSQPVLAAVARAADSALRAMAARGLRMGESGPPPELVACLADKEWQVRYAAYDAAAMGSLPVAIPLLIDARAKAKEDQPRIDRLLGRLTGVAFAEASQWSDWWGQNGDAVRGGTFRNADDAPSPSPDDPCVRAVLATGRLVLVLAADPYVGKEDPTEPDPNVFDPIREATKRALAAIRDDSTFGIVVGGYVPPESRKPVRASDASRRAAEEWLGKLERPPRVPPLRIVTWLLDNPDSIDYADTVLLVSASGRNVDPQMVDALTARLGEMQEGPVIHCVGVGDSYDEYLLASVALQTGGEFAGGETRLYSKIPAPGADRWITGNSRVAAYRALRSREKERDALTALTSIGEEAYPLLPMVMSCLDSDKSDDVRLAALAALGAMGPWAREAAPRVQSLTADASSDLSKAARAALDRISGK